MFTFLCTVNEICCASLLDSILAKYTRVFLLKHYDFFTKNSEVSSNLCLPQKMIQKVLFNKTKNTKLCMFLHQCFY